MSWAEWRSTPWDERRALIDGLEADENVPFSFGGPGEGDVMEQLAAQGARGRTIQAAPGQVIDITGMLRDLEEQRNTGPRR